MTALRAEGCGGRCAAVFKKGARLSAQVVAACGGGLYRRVVFADAQGEGGGFAAIFSPLPQEGGGALDDGG